jgi:hypothetical protein
MNPVPSRIHKALEENELGVVRELPNELLLRSLPGLQRCSKRTAEIRTSKAD